MHRFRDHQYAPCAARELAQEVQYFPNTWSHLLDQMKLALARTAFAHTKTVVRSNHHLAEARLQQRDRQKVVEPLHKAS